MRSLSARLETARTQTYARALLGLVVAVAAFGAGNFVHAQPGQESSPKSTARAADGGYRVVEFSRLLPRAPLPAGVESEPAAAPQILAVSFSAVAGPVRWYPPRRLIDVTVKFDRAVTVNTAGGTPRIDLVLGTRLLRHAGYASGSGSPELTFQYVTGDWNQALSDIAVGASSLRLNGGASTASPTPSPPTWRMLPAGSTMWALGRTSLPTTASWSPRAGSAPVRIGSHCRPPFSGRPSPA